MKKLNVKNMLLIVVLALIPLTTMAQFTGDESKRSVTPVNDFNNQFKGSGLLGTAVKIAEADDKTFVFVGYIIGSVSDSSDMYEFKDDSGKGFVEITDFNGVKVSPTDKIRLIGDAEYDDGVLYLEVDKIEKEN